MSDTSISADVECVLDYAAKTGESPLWSPREQVLYWIDIHQPALHRFDPARRTDRHWLLPDEIGCAALHIDGLRVLVALRSGLYELHLQDASLHLLLPPPFNPSLFRFNEGACDNRGRLWLGTMFDPKDEGSGAAPGPIKGAWYSYTAGASLVPHGDFAVIPNGLGWDADYRTMYVSHSNDRTIYAFDFDSSSGRLGTRHAFATIPEGLGVPDGCAIDEHGGYWSALHGGGRLRRFHPGGGVDRDYLLPVSLPTMCAFGGKSLDTLYVTSASLGLSAEQRAREPLAGRLLRFRPGIRGRASACFGVKR